MKAYIHRNPPMLSTHIESEEQVEISEVKWCILLHCKNYKQAVNAIIERYDSGKEPLPEPELGMSTEDFQAFLETLPNE